MARYAARDRLAYFKLNQAIHTAIARLSSNATLIWAHGAIQARMKRIRYVGHQQAENWAAAAAEHQEMIRALRARDAEALAAVLALHMDRSFERVRSLLAESGGGEMAPHPNPLPRAGRENPLQLQGCPGKIRHRPDRVVRAVLSGGRGLG